MGLLLLRGGGFFIASIAIGCQPSTATMPYRCTIDTAPSEKKTGIRNDVPNAHEKKVHFFLL
jgi:hypothetical protein